MFHSKRFTLQLIESKIIKLNVIDGIDLEQQDAKDIIAEAVKIADNQKYTILFDTTTNGTISFEAREELARSEKRIAVAIVTTSLANKLVGNFFINFHKPASSARIFSDEKMAIDWLQEQIKEN